MEFFHHCVKCGLYIRRTSTADLEKIREEIAKLDRDLQRQNDILAEVCRQVSRWTKMFSVFAREVEVR